MSKLICGICGAEVEPTVKAIDAHMSLHYAGAFVDVRNCRAALAVSEGWEDGREVIHYLADEVYTDDLREALLQAVEDAGGAINVSGRYRISDITKYPDIYAAMAAERWE